MYLKTTSFLSAIVCSSSLTIHCSQKLNNSSVYPIRKYIFLVPMPRWIIPAILIILCCLLIMTSLVKRPCHVPTINFLMKASSTAVSEDLNPPSRFAEKYWFKKFILKYLQVSQKFINPRWILSINLSNIKIVSLI